MDNAPETDAMEVTPLQAYHATINETISGHSAMDNMSGLSAEINKIKANTMKFIQCLVPFKFIYCLSFGDTNNGIFKIGVGEDVHDVQVLHSDFIHYRMNILYFFDAAVVMKAIETILSDNCIEFLKTAASELWALLPTQFFSTLWEKIEFFWNNVREPIPNPEAIFDYAFAGRSEIFSLEYPIMVARDIYLSSINVEDIPELDIYVEMLINLKPRFKGRTIWEKELGNELDTMIKNIVCRQMDLLRRTNDDWITFGSIKGGASVSYIARNCFVFDELRKIEMEAIKDKSYSELERLLLELNRLKRSLCIEFVTDSFDDPEYTYLRYFFDLLIDAISDRMTIKSYLPFDQPMPRYVLISPEPTFIDATTNVCFQISGFRGEPNIVGKMWLNKLMNVLSDDEKRELFNKMQSKNLISEKEINHSFEKIQSTK